MNNLLFVKIIILLTILSVFSIDGYSQEMSNSKEETIKIVQRMPMFPGCENMGLSHIEAKQCAEKKMLEYIYFNIRYPEEARNNGIEGMVVVSYIVYEDGSIKDAKVVRSIGGDCDEEALRVVESFPNWIPGMQDDEPVKVQFNLPIRFKLEAKSKRSKKRKN